jgi:hypothetical protein
MRLLNTTSHKLKNFLGSDIPPYVILSHTWEDEEVLFDDIHSGAAPSKKGYTKLVGCCRKAAEDGFEWAWIDTCCIDKTSSAELSEAINSMYQWYQGSTICYAYLQDVSIKPAVSDESRALYRRLYATYDKMIANSVVEGDTNWIQIEMRKPLAKSASAKVAVTEFGSSRWLTRGWTLQELLAPSIVEFYTT